MPPCRSSNIPARTRSPRCRGRSTACGAASTARSRCLTPDGHAMAQHGHSTGEMPKRVGKYRIDHVIGRGAIGIVYKGYDEQIDRPLAIKTLRREILEDLDDRSELLKRFAAEARSAGRCLHPNIVTVFDLVEQ